MKEPEMDVVGRLICQVLERPTDAGVLDSVRKEVGRFCSGFPLFTY
jgi:glycine/serine hydroxymethyltransferase